MGSPSGGTTSSAAPPDLASLFSGISPQGSAISAVTGLPAPPALTPPAAPQFGDLPTYQQPAADPLMASLGLTSQTADMTATMQEAKLDTASLLARYGARMAVTGVNISPLR